MVLGFFFFFSMWWNRTNCNETVVFFLLHLLTSVGRLSTFILISYLLKLGRTLKTLFLSFFPQTRLVPNRISRRRHSHGEERIQGRRVCQLHGKRGINTLKFYIRMKRACSLSVCAEMGSLLGCSSRGPIRWLSYTHCLKHTHTRHTHSPHGPNYASSGALLTLLPKYRSKNNLPFPVSETS